MRTHPQKNEDATKNGDVAKNVEIVRRLLKIILMRKVSLRTTSAMLLLHFTSDEVNQRRDIEFLKSSFFWSWPKFSAAIFPINFYLVTCTEVYSDYSQRAPEGWDSQRSISHSRRRSTLCNCTG